MVNQNSAVEMEGIGKKSSVVRLDIFPTGLTRYSSGVKITPRGNFYNAMIERGGGGGGGVVQKLAIRLGFFNV